MSDNDYSKTWHKRYRDNVDQVRPTVVLCESPQHIIYMYAPPQDPERRNFFVQNRQGGTKGSFWSEDGARDFVQKEEPDWDGLDYVSGWNNKAEKEQKMRKGYGSE